MGYGTAAQNAILTDEGFTAQEAAKSQQVVTRLTLRKKKRKRRKKRWRTSAVEAEENCQRHLALRNRMDRKRVEIVAETAAVVETGRRSIAQ